MDEIIEGHTTNGEGFYVHAPKQKGNIKQPLGYIVAACAGQPLPFIGSKNTTVSMKCLATETKPTDKKKKKKSQQGTSKYLLSKETVNYICLQCSKVEAILHSVIREFELMDGAGILMFLRSLLAKSVEEECTRNITKVHGYEYRITDRLKVEEW
jgi:hypothetical protein